MTLFCGIANRLAYDISRPLSVHPSARVKTVMIGSQRSGLKRGHGIFVVFHLSYGHEGGRQERDDQVAASL